MSAVYVRHTEDNAVNSQRGVLQDASNRQPAVRAAKKAGVQTRAQRAMADQVVKEPVNEGQNRSNRRSTREEVDPTLASGLAEAIGNISIDDYESDDGIDEAVWNEPECAYLKEIMRHLKATESTRLPSPTYMDHVQSDVTPQMRATLVDWLIYVHRKFKLLLPVLPLAINILDRFLSERAVSKDKLQLVGGVALLIASKFEEIYPPEIDDFVTLARRHTGALTIYNCSGICFRLHFQQRGCDQDGKIDSQHPQIRDFSPNYSLLLGTLSARVGR